MTRQDRLTPEQSAPAAVVAATARSLEAWGSSRNWSGTDPYDALNSRRARRMIGNRTLGLRILTQVNKRSPVDLRPALGIKSGVSAAGLAHVVSAYATNGFLPADVAE